MFCSWQFLSSDWLILSAGKNRPKISEFVLVTFGADSSLDLLNNLFWAVQQSCDEFWATLKKSIDSPATNFGQKRHTKLSYRKNFEGGN